MNSFNIAIFFLAKPEVATKKKWSLEYLIRTPERSALHKVLSREGTREARPSKILACHENRSGICHVNLQYRVPRLLSDSVCLLCTSFHSYRSFL